ncbi:MAG: hypothetical protein AB7O24_24220 [Kofleriaceae bacterium]
MSVPARAVPLVSWADWVGSYDAKLTWQRCSAPGERSAQLALVATDGALAFELAAAGGGLRTLPLIESPEGWQAQQGDVAVALARGKAAGELELRVELDSGCVVTGQLRRRSTAIAACDRLIAWAAIEARCSKLASMPLEDPIALAAERATWKPKSKPTAERCTARAGRVEASLIDAGCAPSAQAAMTVRAPQCTAFLAAAARLSRCTSVPAEIKTRFTLRANAVAAAANSAREAELGSIEAECQLATQRVQQLANDVRCPP